MIRGLRAATLGLVLSLVGTQVGHTAKSRRVTVLEVDSAAIRLGRRALLRLEGGAPAYDAVTSLGALPRIRRALKRRRNRSLTVRTYGKLPVETLDAILRSAASVGIDELTVVVGKKRAVLSSISKCADASVTKERIAHLIFDGEDAIVSPSEVARGPDGCFEAPERFTSPVVVGAQLVKDQDALRALAKEASLRAVVMSVRSGDSVSTLLRITETLAEVPLYLTRLRLDRGADPGTLEKSETPTLIVFGGSAPATVGEEVSLELQVEKLGTALGRSDPLVLFGSGERRLVRVLRQVPPDGALAAMIGLDGWPMVRTTNLKWRKTARRSDLVDAVEASARAAGGTIIFGVGHGSRPNGTGDGSIDLSGGNGRLWVSELAGILDRSKRESSTALVLGHCFSGAFANIMYRASGWGPAAPMRCAFTAVPPDRPADGCVTNASDRSIKAYAWMMGDAFEHSDLADLNGDERVSLAEAHAYARIHDPTSNVPYSSSESWIRRRARKRVPNESLTRAQSLATPEERAVLDALRPDFVAPRTRLSDVRRQLAGMKKAFENDMRTVSRLNDRTQKLRGQLLDRILPAQSDLERILAEGSAEELRAADQRLAQRRDVQGLMRLASSLERRWTQARERHHQAARVERYLRAAEISVLSGTLRARDRTVLRDIRRCEALAPLD